MATMNEKRRAAQSLAYLGEPSKILAALANDYGRDEILPSRAVIQNMIDERARRSFRLYGERRAA